MAARAGVAKGTIYLYFPSKQALFKALIRTGIGAPIEAAGAEAAALDLPFEAVVRGLFTRMRREILATRRKEIIRLVIAESGRFPELAEFYYREVVARGMALLRAAAERAVARGELSSDELVRFPQLVVAPGLVAFLWATLFERFETLDAEAMLEAHLALLLRPEGEAMRRLRIVAILAILVVAGGGAYWWMSAGEDGPRGSRAMSRATSSTWRRKRAGASRPWRSRPATTPGGPAPVRARIVDADRAEERGRGAAAPGRSAARKSQGGDAAAGADRRAARPGGAGEGAAQFSKNEHERQQTLFQRGITAKAQLDNAKAALDRDQAGLEEAQRAILAAQLAGRSGEIGAAEAALRAAEAAVAQAETRLARRRVSAPANAKVQDVFFRAGEVVNAGQPVLSLLPPQNLRLRFYVPEPVLATFALGQTVAVDLRQLPGGDRGEGQLHLARGRIHAAGDFQRAGAGEARVPGRGAAGRRDEPADRPAGERQAAARREAVMDGARGSAHRRAIRAAPRRSSSRSRG